MNTKVMSIVLKRFSATIAEGEHAVEVWALVESKPSRACTR